MKTYLDGQWSLSFTLPDSEEKINTTIDVPCNIEPKLQELRLEKGYDLFQKTRMNGRVQKRIIKIKG